jgi:hypothetical protein
VATLLTTSKMNPALVARIEASVRGQRGVAGSLRPARAAWTRLGIALLVFAMVGGLATSWQRGRDERARLRDELVEAVVQERAKLKPRELQLATRAEAILLEAADADREVEPADELLQRLQGPAVYVRGDREAFGDSEGMGEAVAASVKDSFLLCLLDPPSSRSEKALLAKVMVAFSGGLESRSTNVHRLHTAASVLPLLTRDWMKRVEDAPTLVEIGKLRTKFDRAPMARALDAARATLLIYVFDEPPAPDARVALDGSSRHDVHVGMVDIPTGKPLMRTRTTVDPAWISEERRPEFGRGLNACRLALDVRQRIAR